MDLKQAKALARKRLGDKRYHHTLNVEKMAVKLAGHYGADPDQAALAALLHDTAKEMPTAEQLALLRAHPDLAGDTENRPTPLRHGVCAALLARTAGGVTAAEAVIRSRGERGQVAPQYVDRDGAPSMDTAFNPNGSRYAIEGITSPDGRILGKMGHSERIGPHLYRNVPGQYDMGLFRSAVKFFK